MFDYHFQDAKDREIYELIKENKELKNKLEISNKEVIRLQKEQQFENKKYVFLGFYNNISSQYQ